MANNITHIYFSNTFGDLVRTANNLVNAWNYLGYTDWDKPSGQFSISSEGTGFKALTDAVFAKETRVEGVGSSLYVQNNAEINKTLTLSTTSGDTALVSNGKNIFANGISNYTSYLNDYSTIILGKTVLSNNVDMLATANVNLAVANNVIINFNTSGNTAQFSGNVTSANVVSNNFIYSTKDIISNRNAYVTLTTYTNELQASNHANTRTLTVTGNTTTNILIANSYVTSPELQTIYANTRTLTVTGQTSTDVLQANTSANTRTLTVTGQTSTDVLQANTSANTRTLTVTGQTSTDILQANTSANTRTLTVTGDSRTNTLHANVSILTGSITANTNINAGQYANANNVLVTNMVNANTIGYLTGGNVPSIQNIYSQKGQFNDFTVTGQFIASGSTTFVGSIGYNNKNIMLSANTPSWFSPSIPTEIKVNRTFDGPNNVWYSANCDALLSWSETTKKWRVANTISATSNTIFNYANILTSEDISDDIIDISTTRTTSARISNTIYNTALSASANTITLQGIANTQNTNISNVSSWLSSNNSLQVAINSTQNTNISNVSSWLSSNNSLQVAINSTQNANILIANTKAYSNITVSGTGITVSGSPVELGGTLSLTNAGVTSLSGTANQVSVTASTGAITLSTPQSIHSAATPTFAGLTINGSASVTGTITGSLSGTASAATLATKASTLAQNGADGSAITFNSTDQAGTPARVWGGANNATTWYEFNPAEFVVSSATTATTATNLSGGSVSGSTGSFSQTLGVGGELTSSTKINASGNQLTTTLATATQDLGGIKISSTGTNSAFMAFYKPGVPHGIYFGLGSNNKLQAGGWSLLNNAYDVVLADSGIYAISISGNAASVTNGVYTTGSYNNPSWITALAGSKISGNISGNATNITQHSINQDLSTISSPTFSELTIGTSGFSTATTIKMIDFDGGDRKIRCDNHIGFLTNGDVWGSYCTDDGSWVSVGNVTAYSDIRNKTNITKIENSLEKVQQISGYTFDRTDIKIPRQTGVIAQEVLEVLPEAISGSEDEGYSVAYGNMVGLLIEAIKEQQIQIKELQDKLNSIL